MKKIIIVALVMFLGILPVVKASEVSLVNPETPKLIGFSDGNRYDFNTGEWVCQFLMDGNCYDDNQNILDTRPVDKTPIVYTPQPTPQIVYVPVYIPAETPTPVISSPPIASEEPIKVAEEEKHCVNHLGGGRKIDPNCY